MPNFALFRGLEDAEISQKQINVSLFAGSGGAQGDVVGAAFDDGGGGDQSQLGIPLQVGDVDDTHVAHGALDLVQGSLHIVMEGAGVGIQQYLGTFLVVTIGDAVGI